MSAAQTKNILDALNIEQLEPEEQEELLLDISDLIFKGTLVRLVERMDEKTQDEFNALLDTDPSEDEMQAFIHKHVPDADSAVAEAVSELTDDILAVTKK